MRKGMKKTWKNIIASTLCFVLILSFGACKSSSVNTIAVGSKDFTESLILAELYSLSLENLGFKVDRKYNLGGTNVTQAAVIKGEIDMYPEYTGTGLLQVLKLPLMTDPLMVYNKVADEYKTKYNLVWLTPTTASNSQGLVITKSVSDKYDIKTISDLQRQAINIRFASMPVFEEIEDGMPALKKVYGEFAFKEVKMFDNSLKYQVLENGQMDLAVAFTTDGQLSQSTFVLLEDDKRVWPPYNIAPVIRQETLDKYPAIKNALNKVSAKLENATMQKLNAEVDLNHREYAEVAKEFYDNNIK